MARTRGGWIPTGTSTRRRENHSASATDQGRETRRHIVGSARIVFERNGYVATSVASIMAEAGRSHGTFYTYFSSKQDVFRAVYLDVETEIRGAVAMTTEDRHGDTIANLDRSHQRWLEVYRRNARIIAVNEQVATIDEELRESRLEARRFHVERVARLIRRWQGAGIATSDVDPVTAAGALVAMNSNFAYWWLVGGDEYEAEHASTILTKLWSGALGIDQTAVA